MKQRCLRGMAVTTCVVLFVACHTSRNLHLRAEFSDVKTLREGNEVEIGGVQVGRVIRVFKVPNSPQTEVVMVLEGQYANFRVPRDSQAAVYRAGLLGDYFVNIKLGQDHTKFATDYQLLPTTND